jgi:hypothetical protein
MTRYIEVLFLGPDRDRDFQIFPCDEQELKIIMTHAMAIEDGDASVAVMRTFHAIITRDPLPMTRGDRDAEQARHHLFTLEYRR